jgi:methyl-accepting chemotaxis protein
METPLETLKQSLSAAAAGALTERVAGLERKDEIGAVARAAERFRQAALGEGGDDGLPGLQRLIERLAKDVVRLEADIARLSSATAHARTSIEESSVRAAKASHAAIEAAGIVRESARRIAVQAEDSVSLRRERASPVSPDAFDEDDDFFETPPPGFASDTEADAVLTSLAGDLEALERFARDRKTIASEAAATLTVALVEAIDRLNGVADRIAATADLSAKTQAA